VNYGPATAKVIPLATRRRFEPRLEKPEPPPIRATPGITLALALSIAFHALIIYGLALKLPRFPAKTPESKLEVVLVNSKSARRPMVPDVLAQANLDGGGNTQGKARARSPVLPSPHDRPSSDDTDATHRTRRPEPTARELLSRQHPSKPQVHSAPEVATPAAEATLPPDFLDRSREQARLEAQISRRMEALEARPRREFIGASAREYRFARYIDEWREKIQRFGKLYYPEEAKEKNIHGSLQLTVAIRADGSVERVDLRRSSGYKVLDQAALNILQLAAPFARFSDDIRQDTDVIEITRTWTFTREDQMTAE